MSSEPPLSGSAGGGLSSSSLVVRPSCFEPRFCCTATLRGERRLRSGEERYEVSPTLKLLFPAEEIQALMRTYVALAERAQRGELRLSETGELSHEDT